MRRQLVAGNWKMNTTRESGVALVSAVAEAAAAHGSVDVLVCPPFPYLQAIADAAGASGVSVGSQNMYFEASGAFTGEVSAEMLQDVGCTHVILGHSERRHVLGETDELIHKKVQAALAAGLCPVLCIGELLSEREDEQTESVLERQLSGGLGDLTADQVQKVVIAYEPVWAIGTGRTATPDQAQAAHAFTRQWLRSHYNDSVADGMRILYGGSVKPDNAATLLAQSDVDGALVGGASLKADAFQAIIEAAGSLST